MSLGIPFKLLNEVTGYEITVDLVSGDSFRGKLKYIEDNMNCYLSNVIHTLPNGEKVKVDTTFLRGSSILFFTLPEMFTNAPLFTTGEVTQKSTKKLTKLKRTFTTVTIRKQSH